MSYPVGRRHKTERTRTACLVCEAQVVSIGKHVRSAHGMSVTEYRAKFALTGPIDRNQRDNGSDKPVDGWIECALCGLYWRSLGHHLARAHDMTADQYRDCFLIPRGQPLTSAATHTAFSDQMRAKIEAGALTAHFASNADRAAAAGQAAARVIKQLHAFGRKMGAPATPRGDIESIVRAIEAGSSVKAAVEMSAVSLSAYYAGLKRHDDLRDRASAAKGIRRVQPPRKRA